MELIAYEYEGVTVDYLLHHLEHRLAGRQAKCAVISINSYPRTKYTVLWNVLVRGHSYLRSIQ